MKHRFPRITLCSAALLAITSSAPQAPAVSVDQNDIQKTSAISGEQFIKTVDILPPWKGSVLAEDPDVMDPTALAIDEKGRVFIAETPRFRFGVEDNRDHRNWAKEDMIAQTLEDRLSIYQKYAPGIPGGMSHFTKFSERVRVLQQVAGKWSSKVFADGFNDPLDGTAGGVFAFKGDVWFASIPSVWRLRDTKASGVADQRTAVHRGFGVGTSLSGHDLNGFTMGLDGRLYFSVGDRGYNFTSAEGRKFYAPTSGAVFRMEMDGSQIELVHRGLRNPKELAFDQWGNLFSVDNNADIGDKARIVQIVEGANSGWDRGHQNLATFGDVWEHPGSNGNLWMAENWWNTTGTDRPDAVLPPSDFYGQGPSGMTYFPGTGFGAKWDNTFLFADYSGRAEVKAFRMKAAGAGFVTDFKETVLRGVDTPDIEFGYDGRLYVIDMKSGFMTKNDGRLLAFWDPVEIQAPIVAEVVKLFSDGIENLTSERLAQLLAHQDMRVRLRAQWELTSRPDGGALLLAACAASEPLLKRVHATYGLIILARKKHDPAAFNRLVELTRDAAPVLRARSAEALGELATLVGKPRAAEALLPLLQDPDAQVQMLAAIAIGKTGVESSRPALLALLEKNADADAYLRHGAVMGLAGLGAPENLAPQIHHANLALRRGVLLTLRHLKSPAVEEFLRDPDPALVREAIQAIHDERITAAYPALAKRIDLIGKFGDPVSNRIICAQMLVGTPETLRVLLELAADPKLRPGQRLEALWFVRNWEKPLALNPVTGAADPALLASRRAVEAKEDLSARLIALAAKNEPAILSDALATLETFKISLPAATLRAIFLNQKNPTPARLQVLESLGPLPDLVTSALEDSALEVRLRGLEWLAASNEAAAFERIDRGIKTATIREKQLQVAILGRLTSATSATKLNGWLAQLSQLPPEIHADVLAAGAARKDCAQALVQTQAAFKADPDSLAAFRPALSGGNPVNGRKLFYNSPAGMCSRCHTAEHGIDGGQAGPPLMGVQAKGDDYLLRAVIEPSADFAPGYAPIAVTLKSGETVAGVLVERDVKATKIKLADGKVQSIDAATIASATAPVSPMPPMGALLSLSETRDVVAFLKTLTPENHEAIKAKTERPLQATQKAARYLDAKP